MLAFGVMAAATTYDAAGKAFHDQWIRESVSLEATFRLTGRWFTSEGRRQRN